MSLMGEFRMSLTSKISLILSKLISHEKRVIVDLDKYLEIPGFDEWVKRDFSSPLPPVIKLEVLKRWGGRRTWIETGTFLGQTTLALSEFASSVITIEPDTKLYNTAVKNYGHVENITFIHGLSEDKLPEILESVTTYDLSDVSFWLDGHYSAGVTFKGPVDTPIENELDAISTFSSKLGDITVFVDDVRCFNPENLEYATYPKIDHLTRWANQLGLFWTIEFDIFIATNRANRPYMGVQ
jgi:hypothetical protein